MKRIITLDVEKGRELFTTTDTASLMNMVFASSTNLHISDVVQETEYRRYFSFDCNLTKEEAINRDWSEVDDFFRNTLEDAYRFLNEDEDPVLPTDILTELREVQATYKRRTDIVTLWLREERMELLDEENETTTAMDRMALYKMFKKYVVNNGYPSFSSSRMQQLISASLDIMPVDKEDGKSYYFVRRIADAK
jgi:phage/plasmid-associated DNA primase